MCEPVSCTIAAVVLLCCCCLCAFMVVPTMMTLMAIGGALLEVTMCANETIAPSMEKVMQDQEGDCYKFKDSGCEKRMQEAAEAANHNHKSYRRRLQLLEDDDLQECKTMSAKCFCDFSAELVQDRNPDLHTGLTDCCATFQDSESSPGLGDMAKQAHSMCVDLAHNLTKMFEEVNTNCTASPPRYPSGDMSGGVISTLDGGASQPTDLSNFGADGGVAYFSVGNAGALAQQFNRLDEVWRPGRVVLQAGAIFGGGVVLLAAVTLAVRRTVGMASRDERLEVEIE